MAPPPGFVEHFNSPESSVAQYPTPHLTFPFWSLIAPPPCLAQNTLPYWSVAHCPFPHTTFPSWFLMQSPAASTWVLAARV